MTSLIAQFALTKLALSAALALVAWLVTRRLRSPQVAHFLWLLPLVTMLTPMLFEVPILPGEVIAADAPAVPQDPLPISIAPISAFTLPVASRAVATIDWQLALLLVWAVGSTTLLARSLYRVIRFHRLLSRASQPAPSAVQALAAEVAATIGLPRVPAIITTNATLSPLVWWVGGETRVVIPAALITSLQSDQLRWIIAHELAHVARRDYLVRWVEWCACILFWWNPVAWLARRALRSAEELCCDAIVIAMLKATPRHYAQTLMHVIDWLSHSPNTPTPAIAITAVSSGRTTHLHERLTMIVSTTSLTLPSRGVTAALRLFAAAFLPLGLLGVTAAPAQIARKSADANLLSCESIVANIKPAVTAGTLTAAQGAALTKVCTGETVASRKVTEAVKAESSMRWRATRDTTQKETAIRAFRKKGNASEEVATEWKLIPKSTKAGTADKKVPEAKERLKIKNIDKVPEKESLYWVRSEDGKVKVAECAEAEKKIKVAAEAGKLTASEIRTKLEEACTKN